MSERSPAYSVISDMEDDIYSVLRYAQALSHVAASPNMIEPECLTALSEPLRKIGERLREQFKHAHTAAGGEP